MDMSLNRREFLLSTVAACAAVRVRSAIAAVDGPLLRVGILSDSQGYGYKEDWGFHNLARAFEVLAREGIDVLVNAGDIIDGPQEIEGLAYVQELERKYFGERKPVDAACLGNHELGFAAAKDRAFAERNLKRFAEIYGHPVGQLVHKTVRGFDFITFSCFEDVGYDAAAVAQLKAALDKAVARDAEKPVFVVTHFHPQNTVVDSGCRRGAPLTELFSKYPQVVSLSGHCHHPLQDERCIWQGAFTALETSTLCYGCVEGDFANTCNGILPFGRESVGFMIMDVFADRLEIRRWQAEDQKPMKDGRAWTVRYPYRPSKAVYTMEGRRADEVAPVFAKGTPFLFRYDYGYVYFVFDQACHPDLVHHYRLELTELDAAGKASGEPKSWKYVGNFYRYERNRDRRLCLKVPPHAMKAGTRYRARMFPVASFGTEGRPLEMDIRVRNGYGFRNDARAVAYPQE